MHASSAPPAYGTSSPARHVLTYLVVAFGGSEVRLLAAQVGAAREPQVGLQQPVHLRRVAVPRAGRQPLAEPRAHQGVAHAFPARAPPPAGRRPRQ